MTATLPLQGLRVIEFCWVWSGPMVGQHLADLGADVIKIEWFKRYDLYRMRGVEQLRGKVPEAQRRESSYAFQSLNRNKRSLAADLKSDGGLQVVKDLIAQSDLLLENFTVGTLDRLGLDEAELNRLNPALVVVSLSATGRGSSIESLRSYGLMLSALGGYEHLICDERGDFVGSPTFVMSDPNAALFGLLAALAGTLHAKETGRGTTFECSQVEAVASLVHTPSADIRAGPEAAGRESKAAIAGIFACTDREYVAVELPASAGSGKDAFSSWAQAQDADSVLAWVRDHGGDGCRVNPLGLTEASATFAQTDVRQLVDHPTTGARALIATPWLVDGQRPPVRSPAPRIGEHTVEVLSEVLGYSDEQIAALRDAGSIGEAE